MPSNGAEQAGKARVPLSGRSSGEGLRPLRAIAGTLVVLALAGLAARRLTVDHDISRLLPDSDRELVQSARALRSFLERTVVDVGSPEGRHAPEVLAEAADRFAESLEATGTVQRVRARFDLEDALGLMELLRGHTPVLLSDSAWTELERRTRPEVVLETIEALERHIQEPDGAYLAQRAGRDPLGFGDLVLAPLADLAAGPPGARLVDGRLASSDGRHLLVVVEPGFPASELQRTTGFLDALERVQSELSREPAFAGLEWRSVGTHRSSKENERRIRADIHLTGLVGGGLVALLIFLCFGRLRLALFSITPALVGGVVALGAFSLFRESLAAPVLGFGVVLVGLTNDFAVHVLTAITKGHGRKGLPVRAMLVGGVTTSAAFALLCRSSLPGVRDIGLFGSLGILAAMLYALVVLPGLGPWLGSRRRPLLDLEAWMRRWPVPRRSAFLALALTPFIALGIGRLRFDGDVRHLSSLGPAAAADESAIHRTWGTSQLSSLVIESNDLEQALRRNGELASWLERAKNEGELTGYASIQSLLPARATQERRLARWQAFWGPARRAAIADSLQQAAERTHFRAEAFEPFLRSLAELPAFLDAAALERGPGAALLADRLTRDDETWRLLTPVFTLDHAQLEGLSERLQEELPDVLVANREALVRRIASSVRDEMVVLGGLALLVVTVVVSLSFADLLLTAVIVLPLFLALLWTLGLLGWLGQPLNLINALFVVFLFGLAVDYAIFLAGSYLRRKSTGLDHTAETRGAALLCALTTCAAFGAMALAGHPVLSTIGVTTGCGIAAGAAATQLFVPLLCTRLMHRPLPAPEVFRGARWWKHLGNLYRFHGPFLRHYVPSKARRDPLVGALPELCPGTGSVLVAGCGYGVMTARLASVQPEREVVALDPDLRKLEAARGALAGRFRVRFSGEDVREHAAGRPYERVLLVDVLHYWDVDVQRSILTAVREQMGPESRLVFRDGCAGAGSKNGFVHAAEWLALRTGFTRSHGQLHFRDEAGWRELLEECGLRIESKRPELGLFSNLVLVCSRAGP